jgi:hypothetical protein
MRKLTNLKKRFSFYYFYFLETSSYDLSDIMPKFYFFNEENYNKT